MSHPLLDALRALDVRKTLSSDEVSRAASSLTEILQQIASRPMETSTGPLRIPQQEQADLIQITLCKLLEISVVTRILDRHPHLELDPDSLERSCWAYLRAMIKNGYLASLPDKIPQNNPEEAPAPAAPSCDPELIDKALHVLQKASDHLVANPGKRDKSQLQAQLQGLLGLCTNRTDMQTLLRAEGVLPGETGAAFTKARNRIYQTHKRLREALHHALDTQAARGDLKHEEADVGRACLQTLLVRVQRAESPVRPGGQPHSSEEENS